MKKLVSVLLVLAMLFTTVACTQQETHYSVGIVNYVQHDASDEATRGFKDALTEKLGTKVSFKETNASNDMATCTTIITTMVSEGADLIMAGATPVLIAAANATDSVPIVATCITDYATALEIEEWTGVTGINVTGTADCAPLDEQAAMVKELLPEVKNVGMIYSSSEPNSKYQVDEVKKHLEGMEINVIEYPFADSNDLAIITVKACEEVDAIYIPTDNTVASSTEIIDNIALEAGVPVIAGEEAICRGCGIATFSISYYDIGYAAGMQAYEILENGANPAEMEIEYAANVEKMYVEERCEELGINVPSEYVKIK